MIQVIGRATTILEYVANATEPPRLPEIAEATGLSPATCANILSSLTENGFLQQQGNRRFYSYKIGRLVYQLAGINSLVSDLRSVADVPMERFTESTGASCILTKLEGKFRVLIHEVKTESRLQVVNKPKSTAFSSASGRAILAHFGRDRLDQFIKHYGLPTTEEWGGIGTEDDLKRELQKIRSDGIIARMSDDHIFGVAAAIHQRDSVVAGMGAYLPISLYTEDRAAVIKQNLQECVESIETALAQIE